MDSIYQIPVCICHILEADVSQDTGIIDQNIDATECLYSCLNDLLSIFYAVVIRNGFSTGCLDFVDDNIGGLLDLSVL